jgi:aspartyl-tRNA(Asn)/glutamyl-tRNA(Gln) amidotransferase subunit A
LKSGFGVAAVQLSAPASNIADATNLTLEAASNLIRKKSISPVELTKACLARIEQLNPKLNAYITVTAEDALAQARKAESEIQRGHWRGALHGIPLGIKDNIDVAGVKTTEASAVFLDRVPPEDAEVVRRLKAAGGVLLGKHNMHEVASVISAQRAIRGHSIGLQAGVPAAPLRRYPLLSDLEQLQRMAAARSACPRRTAASLG